MGTTNLEGNQENTHVKHVAEFAIEMISEASQTLIDEENPQKGYVSIRVGFHSGSVVTNVIGVRYWLAKSDHCCPLLSELHHWQPVSTPVPHATFSSNILSFVV